MTAKYDKRSGKAKTEYLNPGTIVRSGKKGNPRNRLLVITPTLGIVRMEWAMSRYGQAVPCNWSMSGASLGIGTHVPMNYLVADAQNLGCEDCVNRDFEWCFLGHTLVETIDGAKPIREILVGDLVKTHTGAFRSVGKTMSREVRQRDPLIWIRTRNSTLKCTPNHPFFVVRDGKQEFIKAENLCDTDMLLYPNRSSEDILHLDIVCNTAGTGYHNTEGSVKYGKHIADMKVDDDMARFLGLFLAEGHCNKDGIALTFNNKETDYIDFIQFVYADKFDRKATVQRTWATQIRLSITSLARRFKEWFGPRAREKRIPPFVFEWNVRNKLLFLKGYFDGDGSYRQGRCTFSSASRKLIEDVIRLGNSCGLSFSNTYTYKQNTIKGYGDGSSYIHLCGIDKQSLDKMLDILAAETADGYSRIRIRSVEPHFVSGNLVDSRVYNLEVSEDNSYIANCASVHNCLLWEDDVIAPLDAFLQINPYMSSSDYPVISGLYFTKGQYSEPILYRGSGQGAYINFKIGDKVWATGVPTGFLLIHSKVIKLMYEESESYKTLGGRMTKRVFETPAQLFYDPDTQSFATGSGTSDLNWCNRVIEEKVLARAGWPKIGKKKYPFLCDTRIFCKHIDLMTGSLYPSG